VVPVEETVREDETVRILHSSKKGEYIRFRGEDIHQGECVIPQGTQVRPAEVGMLATAGYTLARFYRTPEISVLATGDELAEPGETLGPDKIVNSNSYSIGALVTESGGSAVLLKHARDEKSDLESKVRQALMADMALVIGGVSKGKYDYVKEVLTEMGCEMKFWQVSMRPGHPLAFGTFQRSKEAGGGKKLFFGLPGNLPTVEAVLEEEIQTRPGRRQFVRAVTAYEKGSYRVRRTGDQGSGILLSMVRANSLMVLPEDRGEFKAGEKVQVQLLPG
jgi:molybdopterin molybdotransferase